MGVPLCAQEGIAGIGYNDGEGNDKKYIQIRKRDEFV